MSPTVTTVVPGASTSPTSADFTSTTPSTGEAAMVSASCESISAMLARGARDFGAPRGRFPARAASSRARSPRPSSARRARAPPGPGAASICSTRGPASTSASRFLRVLQRRLGGSKRLRYWSNCAVEMSSFLYSVCAAVPILLGALHFGLRRIHRGLAPPASPAAARRSCSSASRASLDARSARRCSISAASVGLLPFDASLAPAPVAIRPTASRRLRARAARAVGRDPAARSTWPFFTASPSSTVRSISRPAVLNAMLTSVSSILPETMRRLSGRRDGAAESVERSGRRRQRGSEWG